MQFYVHFVYTGRPRHIRPVKVEHRQKDQESVMRTALVPSSLDLLGYKLLATRLIVIYRILGTKETRDSQEIEFVQ